MAPAASLLALHVAVALFGFAALSGKWLAWSAVAIVLARALIAAVTLWGVVRLRGDPLPAPSRALAMNGAILALHWFAFFAAIKTSTVATGLLGYATFPLFVLLLERVLQKRPWRRAEIGTAILATAGLFLLVPDFSWQNRTVQGLAWGVLSAITFAWLTVRSRLLRADHPATPLALWQNAFAALCLAPVVAWQGGVDGATDARAVGLVIVLGVFCTALAHTLFIASLARLSGHTAGVVAALEPVYGIVLAVWLLGEMPDVRTWLGAALLVAAAVVASWRACAPAA
jgi:drug/metabolite transporter (DMT)-like permease